MIAETTLRLEMMKFYQELFPDTDNDFRDTSGWKTHFAKNYTQKIRRKDIEWFVRTTLTQMKVGKDILSKENIKYYVECIYNNYKVTIDSEMIAFVLKSKTEMNRNDDKGFWLIRFFKYVGRTFKTHYNRGLENLMIK